MYKKIVRGISLLFAVLMVVSTSAFAMDMRASSRIERSTAQVTVDADGNLWVYFAVYAVSTMDDIGASEIAIQRYNGSRWVTEYTLTPKDAPKMQASDVIRHSASIPYKTEYSGYAYRAVVSVYATDSSGTSTTSATSMPVTMQVREKQNAGK